MSERRHLATLRLHHDALGLSVFRKEDAQRDEIVAWLFELGERFAWLGVFCSTIATEIQKGEHADSSVLVCYDKEPPRA